MGELTTKKTMSSLEIAKLTGKEHSKVKADIKRVLEEAGIDSAEFGGIYLDAYNKERACFNLPRFECDLVVSGYSVKYRAAIIKRWHELEESQAKQEYKKLPTNYIEALECLIQVEKENLVLKEKNLVLEEKADMDKPKVDFAMRVRNMEGACSVGEFSKSLGYGRNRFFRRMREDGLLMANNIPYQTYIDRGLFVVIEQTPFTDSNGKNHPAFTTYVTGKGQVYLENKYRGDLNLPQPPKKTKQDPIVRH